nr:PHP domain-containing protein [Marinicella sp. W31]MDC2877535.1 PHP domain-containing protein [Marinicella sp. W31]
MDDRQPAVAVTDTNNLFCALEFSQKAIGEGLQPIIGCQLSIDMEDGGDADRRGGSHMPVKLPSIVALVANEIGYANLMYLVSEAYLGGEAHESVCIRKSWLEGRSDGLVVLTGGSGGPVDQALAAGFEAKAGERLAALKTLFGDRLYVELQRQGAYDVQRERHVVNLAYELELPLVATNEPFFPQAMISRRTTLLWPSHTMRSFPMIGGSG